jgi:hypothetical protein
MKTVWTKVSFGHFSYSEQFCSEKRAFRARSFGERAFRDRSFGDLTVYQQNIYFVHNKPGGWNQCLSQSSIIFPCRVPATTLATNHTLRHLLCKIQNFLYFDVALAPAWAPGVALEKKIMWLQLLNIVLHDIHQIQNIFF